MSSIHHTEQRAYAAVQEEIGRALPQIRARGLELGDLELLRRGDANHYESELRVYAYRDGEICDALEVHLARSGTIVASLDDLVQWFRSALPTLGR